MAGISRRKRNLSRDLNYKPGMQRSAKGNADRGWCQVSEVGERSGSLRLRQEVRGLDGGEREPGTEGRVGQLGSGLRGAAVRYQPLAVPGGYTLDRGILPRLMGPTCDSSTWKSCDPSLTLRCKEPLDPLIRAQPPGNPVMCLSTFLFLSKKDQPREGTFQKRSPLKAVQGPHTQQLPRQS